MEISSSRQALYYNTENRRDLFHFSASLEKLLQKKYTRDKKLIFLCIGTDRATGDSLGPVLGYKLQKLSMPETAIYGNLSRPVHAQNLSATLRQIYQEHSNPFIVAIDASLGKKEQIGYISLKTEGIYPGQGVNKILPKTGDISITGIVNTDTPLNQLLLQTTRLNTVVKLADFICSAISYTYYSIFRCE